jgi:hypothetical protein
MHEPTHQTVRLERGKHHHPADGVCVMELASMLGREPFTDHPASVCPVIGAVLRAYNDTIDDERRQDLYRFASLAVGTRGSRTVQERRIERCREWVANAQRNRRRGLRAVLSPTPLLPDVSDSPDTVGTAVARLASKRVKRDPGAHAALLRFVESLVAVGAETPDRGAHVRLGRAERSEETVGSV